MFTDTKLLWQGVTHTISRPVAGDVTRVAVRIKDYCDVELASASIPAVTTNNILTFIIPQTITRDIRVGSAVICVSYELAEGRVDAFVENIWMLPATIADADTTPVIPPTDNTFTIRAGQVDSREDYMSATEHTTDINGTRVDIPPATRGQFVALVFPADRNPVTLINLGIGVNVLQAYTLKERTSDDEPWVYTFGPEVEGANFRYQINYR